MMMVEKVGKRPTFTVPASGPEAPHASVKAKHRAGRRHHIHPIRQPISHTPKQVLNSGWMGGWVDGWMNEERRKKLLNGLGFPIANPGIEQERHSEEMSSVHCRHKTDP